MGYIYRTINLINNKSYIGKTNRKNFDPNYYGSGMVLNNALKKYGKKNFQIEILEWADDNQLDQLEINYIAQYRMICELYNITTGGTGGDTMSKHPNKKEIYDNIDKSYLKDTAFRNKMSESNKKKWIDKFSDPEFNSDEYKKMCSQRTKLMWAKRGFSDEDRRKRSEWMKNYIKDHPEEVKAMGKRNHEKWLERSNLYEVKHPDGKIDKVKCLRGWCKDNDLPYYRIYNTLRYGKPSKDGWMVKIL